MNLRELREQSQRRVRQCLPEKVPDIALDIQLWELQWKNDELWRNHWKDDEIAKKLSKLGLTVTRFGLPYLKTFVARSSEVGNDKAIQELKEFPDILKKVIQNV